MRYCVKMFVAAALLVLLPVSLCMGGSLFRKGQEQAAQNPVPGGATIYTTVPAEKPPTPQVHDLVKVVVLEVSSAAANGNTKEEKNTELDASLDTFINWDGSTLNPGGQSQNPQVDLKAKHKTDNKAETKKAMTIKATIKAEVMEVLPNGNLQIEATKTRTVNQETETITLTGVIDPDDISAAGAVFSDDVAQLKLSYTGSGSVSDPQKRGVLTKVLDWIWPF